MKRASFLIPVLALTLPALYAAETPKADTAAPEAQAAAPADNAQAAAEGDKAPAAEAPAAGDAAINNAPNTGAAAMARRLRQKLNSIDTELADLTKPSRALISRCKSRKESLNSQMARLDKISVEASELQQKFNSTANQDFTFDIVAGDDRDKYARDGEAAYKAMIIDMEEKRTTRKEKGMDKFEILRERYQGIPQFKDANERFNKNLAALEKRWGDMQAKEKKRREKLIPAKKQRLNDDDDREYANLEAQFKAAGEDIAQIWYVPSSRNLRMLNNCLNKIRDAKRRRELQNAGKTEPCDVPALLNQFWEMMDGARELLVNGDLEGAQKKIDQDATFNKIVRLNRNFLPDEYKDPLKEQRQKMIQEIRSREGNNNRTRKALESKLAELERTANNIEARIDALLEDIDREKAVDVGEESASIHDAGDEPAPKPEEKKEAPAGPAEQPAAEK